MEAQPLEVTALDCYAGHKFVLYFSDETYVTVSGTALADCFPERVPVPSYEPEDLPL